MQFSASCTTQEQGVCAEGVRRISRDATRTPPSVSQLVSSTWATSNALNRELALKARRCLDALVPRLGVRVGVFDLLILGGASENDPYNCHLAIMWDLAPRSIVWNTPIMTQSKRKRVTVANTGCSCQVNKVRLVRPTCATPSWRQIENPSNSFRG